MRLPSLAVALFAGIQFAGAMGVGPGAKLISVQKIWDRAPHNAFTDLTRFRGEWFCVFREGAAHVSPDGALRVLVSRDGRQWDSAAQVKGDGDLRDAKLSITPQGRLLLQGAVYYPQPGLVRLRSLSWSSEDGRKWESANSIGDPEFWLWRTTWRRNAGYSIGYNTDPNRNLRTIRLYRTRDGLEFETVVKNLGIPNSPGENTIRFLADGTAVCLLRRDPYTGGSPSIPASAATALIGTAKPPYTLWSWKDLGVRIGGPNFIEVSRGKLVAALRLHDGTTRTSLCWLDPRGGRLQEFLALPSGGDTSYAGMVWHQSLLWISYYSTHEGRTAIYIAKVKLP
jgi:hypothetical protein